MKTLRRTAAPGLVLGAACALAAPCTYASSAQHLANGSVERWQRHEVSLVVDSNIATPGFESLAAIAHACAGTWNAAANAMPNAPQLVVSSGAPDAPGFANEAGAANVNGVYVMPDGLGASGAALAITVITYDATTGEILDTDVLFNARDHAFASLGAAGGASTATSPYDVQNTLTHEFGHVFGLGEDPEHGNATMFPSSRPGEVTKRDLDDADRTALAEAYAAPIASTAATAVDDTRGCGGAHVAPDPNDGDEALAVMVSVVLVAIAFTMRNRRAQIGTLLIAASSLVAATPMIEPAHAPRATIAAVRSAWEGRFIRTHVTVRDADGTTRERVLLGGRVGNRVMHVFGAPDGAEMRAGEPFSL